MEVEEEAKVRQKMGTMVNTVCGKSGRVAESGREWAGVE